jgi:hypothetical protein
MPLLDVSFVLQDPMFNQSFIIVRTKRKIVKGRTNYSHEEFTANGVFISLKSEDLNRLPTADRSRSPVYVYTQSELSIGDEEFAPDEIKFRNKIWQVKEINNWHEYGAGFYKALCIERDPTV